MFIVTLWQCRKLKFCSLKMSNSWEYFCRHVDEEILFYWFRYQGQITCSNTSGNILKIVTVKRISNKSTVTYMVTYMVTRSEKAQEVQKSQNWESLINLKSSEWLWRTSIMDKIFIQTLVFMSNRVIREKLSVYFSGVFC